jgi:hypothetical protein
MIPDDQALPGKREINMGLFDLDLPHTLLTAFDENGDQSGHPIAERLPSYLLNRRSCRVRDHLQKF